MPAEGRTIKAKPLTGRKIRRARWLWQFKYKTRGLGLMAGEEGMGKSMILCWLIARLTKGELDGEYLGTPINVAIVATEDDFEDTIIPRLMAAGADLERVTEMVREERDVEGPISFPDDIRALKDLIQEKDIKLIVLDPFISRLSPRLDSHKDQQVRLALEPLSALAVDMDITLIGIIHVNKSGARNPLDAIMGSKAFSAVVRSTAMAIKTSDGDRLLCFPKNNNAPEQLSVAYAFGTLVVGTDPEDGSEIDAPFVTFGTRSNKTARDILEEARGDGSRAANRRA